MPNEQMELLANLIESASCGDDGSESLLRRIVKSSADAAPTEDILQIAQFLYDLRSADGRRRIARN